MDGPRFDLLTRSFASRRTAIAGLLAALLPGVSAAKPKDKPGGKDRNTPDGRADGGPAAKRCLANGQRCGKGSGKRGKKDAPCTACCSGYGTPKAQGSRRCSCRPNTTPCGNDAQCCGGQCTGGRCGPCSPGLTLCQPDGCVDSQTDHAHCGACPNACASDQVCLGGACACTPGSCPDGCCADAVCKPGSADAFCGKDGGSCSACPVGSTCCGGVCCAGCCDGGVCKPGTTDTACGTGGTACAACADGQDCVGGTCTCNGASCAGCCDGTTCRPGTADATCGRNGGVCAACSGTGVSCGGGGTPGVCGCTAQSDATTCADKCGTVQNNCGQPVNCTALCAGCCDGAVCKPGNTDAICGENGAACQACANPNPVCRNQACSTCTTDGQCGAGSVCCSGSCFAGVCCAAGDCPAGSTNACTAHQCRCGSGAACTDGTPDCCGAPGTCTNTETDRNNCGSCGHACTEEWETCQNGTCACGVTSVQAAVNAAPSGGTVYLCPGTYLGANARAAINKNITLIGVGDGGNPATNTILDGNGGDRVIVTNPGTTVTVRGVRITGGNAGAAAGVLNRGTMTLDACTITENTTAGDGGGISQAGTGNAKLTMTNCTISKNTAGSTGGFALAAGTAVLTGCAVTDNTATTLFDGGIFVNTGTTLDLINSTVSGNTAPQYGGIDVRGTLNLTNSTVSDNTPDNCVVVGGTINGSGCAP